MTTNLYSVNNTVGGLNLRASERSLQPGEAFDLMNVELTKNGGILKSNGFIQKNTDLLSGNPKISGIYQYIRSSGVKLLLITAGTRLYTVNAGGAVTQLYEGLADGVPCFFATFNDLCILVNGANAPLVYDGVSVTPLGNWNSIESSGFPTYVEVWKNRLWFAGNPQKPYRLYWSEAGNPSGWNTANGAGSVDINKNDGQKITGIKTFFDAITIFKERSIHQLLGDSPPGSSGPNEFRVRPLTTDLGCVAPRSIVNANNTQFFLSHDRFAALETTTAFGDINTVNVSYKIQPLMDRMNDTFAAEAFAFHYQRKDQIWLFYPDAVSDKNNRLVIYDYSLNAWIQRNGISACTGVMVDGQPYTGSYDGKLYQQDFGGSYAGSPIVAFYKTPWYGMGNYAMNKRFRSVDLTFVQFGNWNIQMQTALDYQTPSGAFQFNQNPSAQTPVWGTALWNQSQWSINTVQQIRQVSDIGVGKVLQLQFSNANANEPFHLLGWDIAYQSRGFRR